VGSDSSRRVKWRVQRGPARARGFSARYQFAITTLSQ